MAVLPCLPRGHRRDFSPKRERSADPHAQSSPPSTPSSFRTVCKTTALRARLSQPGAIRGSTRPADGQNRGLILPTRRGALHFRGDRHPIGTPGIRVHTGLLISWEAAFEMLIVETIAKIRLAYFSRKMTIKAICRDLRVSRKVVRKVIRSQATEFHYERDVQPQPKIGPWRDRLDSLLLENDGKPARERLTLIRLFEELRGFGYEGGYDAVRRYARTWSKERASETT